MTEFKLIYLFIQIGIVLKWIIIWVAIGMIYNFFASGGKFPWSKHWTRQNQLEWKYDVAGGPITILFFIVYLVFRLIKRYHKDDV